MRRRRKARAGKTSFPPQPPSFLPARAFGLAREARHQFRSKNVRAELYNSTNIKLSDFCPTDSAPRSAGKDGNTGSPPPPPAPPPPGGAPLFLFYLIFSS